MDTKQKSVEIVAGVLFLNGDNYIKDISSMGCITSIRISGWQPRLCDIVTSLGDVETLVIEDCGEVNDQVISAIGQLPSLQDLDIDGVGSATGAYVGGFERIRVLEVAADDDQHMPLFMVHKMRRLRFLTLNPCPIAVCPFLPALLYLAEINLHFDGVDISLPNLGHLQHLTSVVISSDGSGVEFIASKFDDCHLRYLHIECQDAKKASVRHGMVMKKTGDHVTYMGMVGNEREWYHPTCKFADIKVPMCPDAKEPEHFVKVSLCRDKVEPEFISYCALVDPKSFYQPPQFYSTGLIRLLEHREPIVKFVSGDMCIDLIHCKSPHAPHMYSLGVNLFGREGHTTVDFSLKE